MPRLRLTCEALCVAFALAGSAQARPHFAVVDPLSPQERSTFDPRRIDTLPSWERRFSIRGQGYKYRLVGRPPSSDATTTIPTIIVPIRLTVPDPTHLGPPIIFDATPIVPHVIASPLFTAGRGLQFRRWNPQRLGRQLGLVDSRGIIENRRQPLPRERAVVLGLLSGAAFWLNGILFVVSMIFFCVLLYLYSGRLRRMAAPSVVLVATSVIVFVVSRMRSTRPTAIPVRASGHSRFRCSRSPTHSALQQCRRARWRSQRTGSTPLPKHAGQVASHS